MTLISTALSGLLFGLGLIVAIGAQNAFVLRQGLRREHVGPVVTLCAVSDLVLIGAGAAGLGAAIAAHPVALTAVTLAGAAVLAWYATTAALRAMRGTGALHASAASRQGLVATLTTAAALTWLNPHVYLDTVVLLGSVSATYAAPWAFAAGAGLASIAWFASLGFGARVLSPLFAKPAAWRVFDAVIATIMAAMAASLLLRLLPS